ncbi:amidophosphoribosyltransferase [Hanstruepera neustonica]|uniref:Amidophosphoribosyltransferase n=1 Tax=Hanstruepera neustonica TaxID=1445657 RepID=A0A2K1E597_9FLAO|nr:amidophosphoribosyltransferase [Hanstruepera neustonica]
MLQSLINIFYPKVCYTCNLLLRDNEQYICTKCRHDLPVTNCHFNDDKSVLNIFYGRCKLENATALFWFEKRGITQKLIHNLKYKGFEEIGLFLGDWLGEELKSVLGYQNIDLVIPVPLHRKKLSKRGYNQVAKFGEQIAKALDAKYQDDVLIKATNTNSQVHKNRIARWLNASEIFKAENLQKIENKHILLVDDIVTTGATVESCVHVLHKAQNVKISLATMAVTS